MVFSVNIPFLDHKIQAYIYAFHLYVMYDKVEYILYTRCSLTIFFYFIPRKSILPHCEKQVLLIMVGVTLRWYTGGISG